MFENDKPLNHPHHTRLYIILGIVLIIAALFFIFKKGEGVNYTTPDNSSDTVKETPINENGRVTLTAEEQAEKEKILSSPTLNAKTTLTPAQKREKEAQLKALSQ